MKAVVLLSAGYNPATGNPAPPAAELCALRLAADAGAETVGLHAGPQADAVRPALGHGVSRIRHLQVPAHSDVLPALADEISRIGPDLVLAGNRATGGGDTGLLPYLLAKALGWPILSDAVRLSEASDGALTVEQALPKGMQRRVHQRFPMVLTVHPSAPAALPYAFGQARRGRIETVAAPHVPTEIEDDLNMRPHRPRARIMRGAVSGGSAADRLKAATASAAGGGGDLLVNPDPETAARAILSHLRRIGALPPP
ncbi:electron transfer flavoprotein subunit beta [Aureimonas altamirensis]|uniref:electron transfer flavoprotein subunit beta n=1 Tax=Aureimonas altamirensis TaxID=370622 RepID=UPI0025564A8E|nr:electron transfer flavoprotein subunit beta [Aureimonas altamirensis]